jgi:hypothetical protein
VSQTEAVTNHQQWLQNKAFFERKLTQYRNDLNGKTDDCMIIFFDAKTGAYNLEISSKDVTRLQAIGLLEVLKTSLAPKN